MYNLWGGFTVGGPKMRFKYEMKHFTKWAGKVVKENRYIEDLQDGFYYLIKAPRLVYQTMNIIPQGPRM